MALIAPPDRVLETSTTVGTGTYTLDGAMTGYRAASAVCANGDTAYYYAEDVDGNGVPLGSWETGLGTWGTGGTLARTAIHTSSNANAAVNWSAGIRRVSLSLTATQMATLAFVTSANNAAARTALGATTVGSSVFVATDAAAARTALDIKQLQSIDYSLSGNALTLKLNPTNLDFRSTTLTTGAPVNIANASQITTTISSGSTAGTTSAAQSDIILLAINNAGTMELAWTNAAGGVNLDEQGVITTVAEGGAGAADSANVIYSTTARTGVAYRVVGLFRSTQTTAGTWAQTPTLVQGVGGQALIKPTTSMVRLNSANGYGSTNTLIRRFSTIVANTGSDITYADSATLGASFTINTPGVYAITYTDAFNTVNSVGLSLNTTGPNTNIAILTLAEKISIATTAGADFAACTSSTIRLSAGDVIRPHVAVNAAISSNNEGTFTIVRIA
jgi:hypothetical protein